MPVDPPVGYTCVCKRHDGGHPHSVSRAAWYKHLKAAESEEERAIIRAGNLSLDLHAQIQAHAQVLSESSSGPSKRLSDSEVAQGSPKHA